MLLAGRKTDTPPAVQKNPGLVWAACSGRSQQHPRPTCVPGRSCSLAPRVTWRNWFRSYLPFSHVYLIHLSS